MGKFVDITGMTFNRLKVMQQLPSTPQGSFWRCKCICGAITELPAKLITSNTVKSCGCFRQETTSSRSKIRPFEALFNSLIISTKHKVALTYEQFLEFTKETLCHYCDERIVWCMYNNRGRKLCRYNLDRKDNLLGYTADNCVVCCKRCNLGKGSLFSYEEWLAVGALIKSWRTTAQVSDQSNHGSGVQGVEVLGEIKA